MFARDYNISKKYDLPHSSQLGITQIPIMILYINIANYFTDDQKLEERKRRILLQRYTQSTLIPYVA